MADDKSYVLSSGTGLTNAFVYTQRFTTKGFAKTGLTVEAVKNGSGVQYTVRGYPVESFPMKISVTSGTILTSGDSVYMSLSDPYDQIDVGLKALVDDRSGAATVYVTGHRR